MVLLLCLISATLVLLFSWAPKGGLYPFVSRKMWGPGLLWLAGAKLRVSGVSNLDPETNYIYFSNHQSHYDIPSLCAALPSPLYFIAKRELLKIPVFGWGMYSIGMVFVDRSNPERARASMAKAAVAIKKGKSILAFPEGTRSKDGKLQPFKKGVFHVAKSGNIPMVPVAIMGSSQVLPHTGKLAPGEIHVEIGQPINAAFVASASLNELAAMAHLQLSGMIEQQTNQAQDMAEGHISKR
jgi:1-acyl-sn-glycerol-3-phosphate acyltransferase